MAAKLVRAKVKLSLAEPDLVCDMGGRRFFIACKRPFSEKKVENHIKEAKVQILKILCSGFPGDRGVIAISITRLLNSGDRIFVYSDEGRGRDALARELEQIANNTAQTWAKLGKKIVGILFHIATMAFDREADRIVLADQITAHPIAQEGSQAYQDFRGLVRALESIGY